MLGGLVEAGSSVICKCNNIIMGSSLCPANRKDILPNLADNERTDKNHPEPVDHHRPPESEDHLAGRLQQRPKEQARAPSSEALLLQSEESSIKDGLKKEEGSRGHSLAVEIPAKDKIVTVADVLLEDGWKYSGTLKGQLPEGKGEEVGPNGDRYLGDFKNGQKNGQGTYEFSNGAVYKGQFKDNLMNGHGVFQFPNGDVFEGWFKDNMREGMGKYTPRQPNIDGMLYFEGEYRKDVKNGPGVIKYQESEVRGVWKDGVYDYSFST